MKTLMVSHARSSAAAHFWLGWLLLALLAIVPGMRAQTASPAPPRAIPVILDTDIGDDIDDTWALGFLLKCPELDLKLVVGDNGKPQYRARLLAKFLEGARRTDVTVGLGLPVAGDQGGAQQEWIKDYDLKKYPGKVREDGVQAIIDAVMKSPEKVTIIAIGPVQNLAEALRREPRIGERGRFVGMHGSVRVGYGSDAKPVAEYNVKVDPKACQAVFRAPWEVVITPLDTCGRVSLRGEAYHRVLKSRDPAAANVIANYQVWEAARSKGSTAATETHSSTLFDTVAVYLAFRNDWCAMERIGIRVTDAGLTVEDPQAKKVNVALSWKNQAAFEDFLAGRLAGAPAAP